MSPSPQEIDNIVEGMINVYGDKLPDPLHHPAVFQYYLNLYMFYHHKGNENVNNQTE